MRLSRVRADTLPGVYAVINLGGSVVVLTRDDPDVAAIVAGRVGDDDKAVNYVVPFVVIRHQGTSRAVGSGRAANARLSKQSGRYAALCYGQTRVQAEELARAVSDAWHERGIRDGTNGAVIRQSWADVILPATNDPGRLKKPYATVYIDVLAEAQPLG